MKRLVFALLSILMIGDFIWLLKHFPFSDSSLLAFGAFGAMFIAAMILLLYSYIFHPNE